MSKLFFQKLSLVFFILLASLVDGKQAIAMLGDDNDAMTVAYTKVIMRDESGAIKQLYSDLTTDQNINWAQLVAMAKQEPHYVERGYGKNTRKGCRPTPPPPKCGYCGGSHNTYGPWCSNCRAHHNADPWCTHHRQHHNQNPWCSHHGEHHDEIPWCTHCRVHTHTSDPWCTTCNIHHTATEHAAIEETARQARITRNLGGLVSGTSSAKTSDVDTIKREIGAKKTESSTTSSTSSTSSVPSAGGLMFDDDM